LSLIRRRMPDAVLAIHVLAASTPNDALEEMIDMRFVELVIDCF